MLLVRFVLWKIFIVFETGLCCNIEYRYHQEMAMLWSSIGVGVDIGVGVSDNVDGYV